MDELAWSEFLRKWSELVIRSGEFDHLVRAQMRSSKWRGSSGASEPEILATEKRLGRTLPPSYRRFLKVSNGWCAAGPFVDRMWSAAEVGWLVDQRPDLIEGEAEGRRIYAQTYPNQPMDDVSDAEYLRYGPNQEPYTYRSDYLKTALAISDMGDNALFLLNPRIIFPSGEWEAWFFAHWLPGARRYESFETMMKEEYQSLLALRE